MRSAASRVCALAAAAAVFALLAWPAWWLRLLVWREVYRLAEFFGIMDRGGALGGQVLGHNYIREPAWMHTAAPLLGAAAAYGPALAASLLALRAVAGGRRATLCGGCGSVLRGLRAPRCPRCGRAF